MQAADDFAESVRPIYGSSLDTRRLPEHIGSCILLDIDGTKVVSTAAHIAAQIRQGVTLFVTTPVRPQLVPITGSVKASTAPHSDCAFWRVPDDVVEELGAASSFLGALRLSHNRAPLEHRYYTAFGYAVSRNSDQVNHAQRSIAFAPSMHTSNAVSEPNLAKKLGVSGDEHIFVRFERRAEDADGATVNTFHPRGLSGGALFDLGDFTSPAIYAAREAHRALLGGMIIEYHKSHRALVAVKIGPIVDGIRKALAQARQAS
jgi:hypothetical protein